MAIGVLFVFRLLTNVGTWRWDSWDARERRWLRRTPFRRTPFPAPFRAWPYLLAAILSITALLATSTLSG